MGKAKKALYIGLTRAHNEGDYVDDDRAKQYGWTDDVEADKKEDTKKETGKDK